jgi:hypothetical protein
MGPDARRSIRLAVLGFLLAAGTARAATTDADVTASARPPLRLEVDFGFRSSVVRSAGFEAFSNDKALTQGVLSAGYRLGSLMSGFTVGFEWNDGGKVAQVRGSTSSIGVNRLAASLQCRVFLWRRLLAFGRLAPGAVRVNTTLEEPSVAPSAAQDVSPTLSQTKWLPALDASAGLGLRFGDLRGVSTPVFGLWLLAEAGYSYAPSYDLVLASSSRPLPNRTDAPVRLGNFSPSAIFMRFAVALTF